MSPPTASPTPISTAPGGNVYVGPSLTSSLLRLAAALAAARPQGASAR
jgi:hypothetical protein